MHTDRDLLGMFNNLAVNRFGHRGQWFNHSRWKAAQLNRATTETPATTEQLTTEPTKVSRPAEIAAKSKAAIYKPGAKKPRITYVKPTSTPPQQESTVKDDTPAATTTDTTTTPTTTRQSWYSYVRLDMQFYQSQFEETLRLAAEDAADGEISEQTLSRLRVGLHVDLAAKGVSYSESSIDGTDGQAAVNSLTETDTQASRALRSMARAREYRAGLFYKDSLKSKYSEKQVTSDGFLRTSRKLAIRYTQDFSFKFRSLQQFNSQASDLSQTGNADQYINTTEALVDNPDVSGDVIGQFFDSVQSYLGDMKSDLIDKVNGFFDSLAQQLGISADTVGSSRDMLLGGIETFFNRVDSAVSNVAGKYLGQPESPPAPETVPEGTETVTLEDTTETTAA